MPKKPTLPILPLLCAAFAGALAGCARNPNLEVSGSFFPAWIISIFLGIAGTLVLRRVFLRRGIDPFLRPSPLVYGALALALTLLAWIILYS